MITVSEAAGIRGVLQDAKEEIGHARVLLALGNADMETVDLLLLGVQHRLRFLLEPGMVDGDAA